MAKTNLRARLKRLFSTNVIVRHAGGKRLKIADTDRVQSAQRNNLVDRFSRLHSTSKNAGYPQGTDSQVLRMQMFQEYEIHHTFNN